MASSFKTRSRGPRRRTITRPSPTRTPARPRARPVTIPSTEAVIGGPCPPTSGSTTGSIWCIACPMHFSRDGRRRPSQHVAGCDDRAGHLRAAVHARTDDQPLPEWTTGGTGRARPAGSHTRGSSQRRYEGCLARVRKHQGGNACGDGELVVRSVRLHDSPVGHAGERTKKCFSTSRLFTGRFVVHEDDSPRRIGAH